MTIEGEMTIFWSITKLGKSVRRVIQEGSLALFRTSYKELIQCGIHLSSGVHHLFLKRDKFHSESAGFTLAITCSLYSMWGLSTCCSRAMRQDHRSTLKLL